MYDIMYFFMLYDMITYMTRISVGLQLPILPLHSALMSVMLTLTFQWMPTRSSYFYRSVHRCSVHQARDPHSAHTQWVTVLLLWSVYDEISYMISIMISYVLKIYHVWYHLFVYISISKLGGKVMEVMVVMNWEVMNSCSNGSNEEVIALQNDHVVMKTME